MRGRRWHCASLLKCYSSELLMKSIVPKQAVGAFLGFAIFPRLAIIVLFSFCQPSAQVCPSLTYYSVHSGGLRLAQTIIPNNTKFHLVLDSVWHFTLQHFWCSFGCSISIRHPQEHFSTCCVCMLSSQHHLGPIKLWNQILSSQLQWFLSSCSTTKW